MPDEIVESLEWVDALVVDVFSNLTSPGRSNLTLIKGEFGSMNMH